MVKPIMQLSTQFTWPEQRQILRLFKFLSKAPAISEPCSTVEQCLITSDVAGSIRFPQALLAQLFVLQMIVDEAGTICITPHGRRWLQWLKTALQSGQPATDQPATAQTTVQKNAAQHHDHNRTADITAAEIDCNGVRQQVRVNLAESPLSLLYRYNKQTGRRFLTEEEFNAGERLRADFTRAQMLPSISASWEPVRIRRGRTEHAAADHLSDYILDCRQRVEQALEAVGPELSGLLLDICCFLKGVERVERERGWPVRSAKLLLKTALSMLHRHYAGRYHSAKQKDKAPAGATRYHWGDTDYRPTLTKPV